jgi:hypothetical protein
MTATEPTAFVMTNAAGLTQHRSASGSSGVSRNCGHIRRIFAYTASMFNGRTSGIHPFVIICKGCRQNIPAPVQTMPDSWIVADCPLCRERRRYLPAEIFQGRLSHQLEAKPSLTLDRR